MAKETYESAKIKDFERVKEAGLMKPSSDRAADYCRRAINLGYRGNFKRIPPVYTIIEQLEKNTDSYCELDGFIADKKVSLSEEVTELLLDVSKIIESFTNLFYNFDPSGWADLVNQKNSIRSKIEEIISKANKNEQKVLLILNTIVNTTFNINGPLILLHI